MRPSNSDEVVVQLPLQTNLDDVFTVDGEPVTDGQAASRAKWQIFIRAIVLRHELRRLISLKHWRRFGIADRKTTDHLRRRHIALEQRWRHRQHAGDVLKP